MSTFFVFVVLFLQVSFHIQTIMFLLDFLLNKYNYFFVSLPIFAACATSVYSK